MKHEDYREFSARLHGESLAQNRFVKAQYEITYTCNLHCVHCYTDPYNTPEHKKKELPLAEAKQVLDHLKDAGILWLCFTGGEIFSRRDFLELYDYALDCGFIVTLFTNATLVTNDIADHLSIKRPFCIEVSVYGATESVYEQVTQVRGSFTRFKEGLLKLHTRGLPLKLKAPLIQPLAGEIERLKEWASVLKLDIKMSHLIYPRLNGDTSSTAYRLSASEIVALSEFDPEEIDSCTHLDSSADPRLYRCGCGKLNAHVDPSGGVGACTWARKDRFNFRSASIQDGMQVVAKNIQSQYYTSSEKCFSCEAAAYCGKNPEMAFFETGGMENPVAHFCDVAFGLAGRKRKD